MPNERPQDAQRGFACADYSLHPLSALDGVLIYVTLNGEAVGYFFGRTEELAAEAVAAKILQRVATESEDGA